MDGQIASFKRTDQSGDFESYWRSLRGGGSQGVPRRSDFQPRAIKALLPYMLIVDMVADDMIFRLTGTAIEQRSNISLTGAHLSSLAPDPLQFRRAMWRARTALEQPCGYLQHFQEIYSPEASCVSEATWLPVRSDREAPDQLFCLVVPLDYHEPGEPHAGFRLGPTIDHRFFDIGAGLPALVDRPLHEFSD